MRQAQLRRLRIPSGWAVLFNNFVELPPSEMDGEERTAYLDEDLLLLESVRPDGRGWATSPDGRLLDLGWWPRGSAEGAYRLRLYQGDEDQPLVFSHQDPDVVAAVIERWLEVISSGATLSAVDELLRRSRDE